MTTTKTPRKMRARVAFVWVEGARPPVPKVEIVRDRRTGLLAEVALAEIEHPLVDEGDPGVTHVVSKGEVLFDDDPIVRAKPFYFVEAE